MLKFAASITLADAKKKLESISQSHLLHNFSFLTEDQKNSLLEQINRLDTDLFLHQQQLVRNNRKQGLPVIHPLEHFSVSGNLRLKEKGQELLRQGKGGCLLVAGGQGSRFENQLPKGLYPLSLIRRKTLFQIFAEKVKEASRLSSFPLPIAIMTSPLNHPLVIDYFAEHRNFGLDEGQLFFFSQGTLPFVDDEGNLFLESPGKVAEGPDGNGSALSRFVNSTIWEKWKDLGIDFVSFILIDNPLADPFDAELVAFHESSGNDATIKAMMRGDPDEKVGIIVQAKQKVQVVEYTEISDQERGAVSSNGTLKHPVANMSQFCFSMDFIKHVDERGTLPFHLAHKKATALTPPSLWAWKFERFIFDALPMASSVSVLVYPRNECYGPLKNSKGPNSPETVQDALQERDRVVFEKLIGKKAPAAPFELSQEFYYPTQEFLDRLEKEGPEIEDGYFS